MSGGRATVAAKKGKGLAHVAGDICAIHSDGEVLTNDIFVECKHLALLEWDKFLILGTGTVTQFWKVACEQAQSNGKEPLLIAQQNRYPAMAIFPLKRLTVGSEVASIIPAQNCMLIPLDLLLAFPFSTFISARRIIR